MKISGFTFLRNAEDFGYPFIQSINSILPLVDEFIVNIGNSHDNTLARVRAINSPKIKIIQTQWNEHMCERGFTYGQQKMIAQYACTGEWLFYLEGDEIIHEQELEKIHDAMKKYRSTPKVEALVFDYYHFYGNLNTYVWSPAWYRKELRVIKGTIRSYAPDGLYWVVLDKKNKKGRYPYAAKSGATIYHYGWARSVNQMQRKFDNVSGYWNNGKSDFVDYAEIDPLTLHRFEGLHPSGMEDFFPNDADIFKANPEHVLTKRERKHRLSLKIEKMFGIDLTKKHYKLV